MRGDTGIEKSNKITINLNFAPFVASVAVPSVTSTRTKRDREHVETFSHPAQLSRLFFYRKRSLAAALFSSCSVRACVRSDPISSPPIRAAGVT